MNLVYGCILIMLGHIFINFDKIAHFYHYQRSFYTYFMSMHFNYDLDILFHPL